MGRCKPKKGFVVPSFLTSAVQQVVQASSVADISACLQKFDAPNSFEKAEERNLHNWYEVLDKFDEILEIYVRQHEYLSGIPKPPQLEEPTESSNVLAPSRSGSTFISGSVSAPGGRGRMPDLSRSSFLPRLESLVRSRVSERQSGQLSSAPKNDQEAERRTSIDPIRPELVVLVLKATRRLVRNASHETKSVYRSFEHICSLLYDSKPAITMLALEVLHTLLMRPQKHRHVRSINGNGFIDRLHDLAQGWGGREKGLGLLDCCSALKESILPVEGHSLTIEFKNSSKLKSTEKDSDVSMKPQENPKSLEGRTLLDVDEGNISCTVVGEVTRILIRDVRDLRHDEKWLITEFSSHFNIPKSKLPTLLIAYRRAKSFGKGRTARLSHVCQQLLALATLGHLSPTPKPLSEILLKEQELVSDIVTLAKGDVGDGLHDIPKSLRTLAVRCLASLAVERSRLNQIIAAAGVNTHHGMFSSLLRSEISLLLGQSPENEPSASAVHVFTANYTDAMEERMDADSAINVRAAPIDSLDLDLGSVQDSNETRSTRTNVYMAESLLTLVHNIASHGGATGASGLVSSGVLGIIVPLLRDRNPAHSRAVAQGIRAMHEIIQITHSSVGAQSFRDHDGLTLLAERIAVETLPDISLVGKQTDVELEEEDDRIERSALKARGESRELYEQLLTQPITISRALSHEAPSSTVASRGALPHSKWTILRSLHQLFLHALGNGGNSVRDLVANSALPHALRQIIARPFHFGGGLFSSAMTVTTTIAHSEPMSTGELLKAGIAKALLKSIAVGLPPHGEALKVVPNAIAAMCLASEARDPVVRASPIRPYILRLATPFYSRALQGEIPPHIGGALDEMMRHVDALREMGNEALIEFLKTAASFVEMDISSLRDAPPKSAELAASTSIKSLSLRSPSKKSVGSTTASEKSRTEKSTSPESNPSEYVLLERMKLSVAHIAARLVGFSQGSSEHQKSIVSNKGLQELLKLRIAPALASTRAFTKDSHSHPSFRCAPTASGAISSLATSLRSFTSRHDAQVLQAIFQVIREDTGKVLRLAARLGDAWLPEEEEHGASTISERETGSAKRLSNAKDSSTRKRSRTQNIDDEVQPASGSSPDTKTSISSTRRVPHKSPKHSKELNYIRADLRNALCVLRVDVVLLSSMSRSGHGSLAAAWEAAGGASIISLLAAVERSVRWHLAVVYSGLNCSTGNEGDLCTALVSASRLPSFLPTTSDKLVDGVSEMASQMGVSNLKAAEFFAASKTFPAIPEFDDNPRVDVKGLAWAMETFAYSTQKLYMSLGRGLVYSSRRLNRDPSRYAIAVRGIASTIGTLFALHLKAADTLWSRNVATLGEAQVCAAWDYVRRILIEMKSTLFCESNRNTQGLILRFFLSAGGADALRKACKPLSLLKGTYVEVKSEKSGNPEAYKQNKKQLNNFLKSNHLHTLYTSVLLWKVEKQRKNTTGESVKPVEDVDSDAIMSTESPEKNGADGKQANIPSLRTFSKKELEELEKQVRMVSENVIHARKQTLVNKIAGSSWTALCNLLVLFCNCPGLNTSPGSLPTDPELTGHEWQAKDIQRTSQTVTMKLLMDVTQEPSELLSESVLSGSRTADVVSIIISILRSSSDLTSNPLDPDSENRPDSEELERHTATDEPATPISLNPQDVSRLVEMGYAESVAREALRQTFPPGGVEHAVEWILSQHDEGELEEEAPHSDDNSAGDVEDQNESDAQLDGAPDMELESGDTEMNSQDPEDVDSLRDTGGIQEESTNIISEGEGISNLPVVEPSTPVQAPNDSPQLKNNIRTSKTKLQADDNSEELLLLATNLEMGDVSATISNIPGKCLSKLDRNGILAMVNSLVGLKPNKSTMQSSSGTDRQRRLAKAKSVSIDSYKSSKKVLFESLIPVAMAAIKHEVSNGSSSHASFVAVEILSILQKDKCLPSDVRSEVAKMITEELKKYLVIPSSTSCGINSVVGIRMAYVWTHYGGSHARQALKASGAADLVFQTLFEISKTWEAIGSTASVDEQATKPIKHLSINEKMQSMEHVVSSRSADSFESDATSRAAMKSELLTPIKSQSQLLGCLTTCVLVLDGFIRYEARDSIVRFASEDKTLKSKDSNAMDVDATENKEESSTDQFFTADVIERVDQIISRGNLDISNMDVDEITESASEQIKKLNLVANGKRKYAVEEAVADILSLSGAKSVKKELPFSTAELLRCCTKLISALQNYEAGDCMLALLQLVSSLTADSQLATHFMEEDGVAMLLHLPYIEVNKSRSTNTKMVRSLVRTIIRHVVEDMNTLTEAMEAEIRCILQPSQARGNRQTYTVRTLISTSSGMISRNLECFTRALAQCTRARNSSSVGESSIQATEKPTKTPEEWMVEAKKRSNVVAVVGSLVKLCESNLNRQNDTSHRKGLIVFALNLLAELVEFAPVIAAEFLQVPSPSEHVNGRALDYFIQKLLPMPDRPNSTSPSSKQSSIQAQFLEQEEVSEASRSLVLSLLSKTANAQKATIHALANAARLESEREKSRGGVLKSLSLCIIPSLKLGVLKEMLEAGIANSLAKSLDNLDMSEEPNIDVTSTVLKALSIIGHTARQISRPGFSEDDNVIMRDMYPSMRERSGGSPLAGGFMVL